MSDSIGGASSPQTITFNQIPATLRDPRVVAEIRPTYGNVGLLLLPSKALIISQMLSAGVAATAGVIYPITGKGQAEALFGAGSIAATQINAWLANNTTTPLFAAALADPAGGTKASATVLIGAASFAAGFGLTAQIAGQQIPIAVPAGTAALDLANALIAAVNATPALPVTAALVASSTNVMLTAKNAGLCGNDINVNFINRSDASAPLVAISVAVAGTPSGNLSGGLGVPLVQPVLTTAAATWYTDMVIPWTDTTNLGAFTAELVRRYGALVRLDARGYIAINGSYATVAAFGDAGNCIQLVTVGVRGEVEPSWVWSAVWGAIHAFRLANDPSRQSKGIAAVGLTAPTDVNKWLPAERDLLLNNGISTWTALNDGTVVISRTITGYLVSNDGVADAAWLDVMTPATMTAIRYDWTSYVKLVYPQAKLFDDDSVGAEYDNSAATARRMRGSWAKRCLDYERAGWIEGSASTVQQGYFVRNASDKNRLDQQTVVTIAGNLMIEASVLEFEA